MCKEEYSAIVSIEDDGQTIELEDGSTWRVAFGDNTRSLCWNETQRVAIDRSEDESFPYELRNLDTAGNVRARRGSPRHIKNIVSGRVRDIGSINNVPNAY